jgi:hypothetical protein
MANPYRVTLRGAADDGTNTYCEIEVSDGSHTFPLIRPVFPTGVSAATIQAYMQVIANNQPTLAADIQALINVPVLGA